MKKSLLAIAAAACAIGSPAAAAVNISVEGGGTPVVWEEDGNRFGLLGIDAREQDGDGIVNAPDFVVDLDYVNGLIASGPSLVELYSCVGGFPCTPGASILVSDEDRLFDSLIGEFAGSGNVVFNQPVGGTDTLGLGTITRQGSPPIGTSNAVPEPTTWLMLLLGVFAIAAAMRSSAAREEGAFNFA